MTTPFKKTSPAPYSHPIWKSGSGEAWGRGEVGDGGGGTTIECSILVDNILWYYSPPSVGLSGRPSLGFLKIGWLVFSDIVHEDSWPWYLVTDEARFKKKKLKSQMWVKWTKIRPKFSFLLFSQVWFISFPWNCIQWQLAIMSNM